MKVLYRQRNGHRPAAGALIGQLRNRQSVLVMCVSNTESIFPAEPVCPTKNWVKSAGNA